MTVSKQRDGRRNRDRTCDPSLVRAVLSQLSYPPETKLYLNTAWAVLSTLVIALRVDIEGDEWYKCSREQPEKSLTFGICKEGGTGKYVSGR